jgi:hypothetical protein
VAELKYLADASNEVGLKVKAAKTKYMLLFLHRNARENHNLKIANRAFENVAQFRYLGTTVTSQNFIQKEYAGD